MAVRFEVDPGGKLKATIEQAIKECDDLTIPFRDITASWFKSNRAIFALKGPGKYDDLSPAYKEEKKEAVGFIYPILKRSGALAKSITEPGAPFSIARILNKKTLQLGSSIPYGSFHQFGTKIMPQRPWVIIGAEQTAPANEQLNRRGEIWTNIIRDYVLKAASKVGTVRK